MPRRAGLLFQLAGIRLAGVQLVLALAAPVRGATPPPQVGESCRVDYRIRARVDVPEKTLAGTETILWKNESRDDVPDLWFHLYWNAFANDRSTHMRESGRDIGMAEGEDEWGWQELVAIEVDGKDLLPSLKWRAPEDRNEEDRTVFSVQLEKPVRAGESLAIDVRWKGRIPRVRRRTGQKGAFLFVAQWFPKLGVYETGNGWNCRQFHGNTEFFSDYGAYDVTLDLPEEYQGRIGASGILAEPEKIEKGRVTARFVAPSAEDQRNPDPTGKRPLVHDFAWTADPRYQVLERRFRYDEWAARYPDDVARTALALGRGIDEMRLRDVDVTVLLHPEHASQGERHFDAACTSLFFYGLWFGGYPYQHITVVDPAYGAGAAGGMEYPTLFTAGSRLFATPGMLVPESVTVHECGHQFWYGLVGNNEFEASWLDEGFNTFTQSEALSRRYGLSQVTTDFAGIPFDGTAIAADVAGGTLGDVLALRRFPLPGGKGLRPIERSGFLDWWRTQPMLSFARQRDDPRMADRAGYLVDPETDPVDTPAWRYADARSYRTNSYRRTATILRSLAGMVGWERFLRGMRLYSERWRYGHPYAQDFFAAFQEGAEADIPWFFDAAFRSTETVDWSVEVAQKREPPRAGWFQDPAGVFSKADPKDAPPESERPWRIDLMVRRKGTLLLPLKLALRYEDGSGETLLWPREDQARTTWWKPLEGREASPKKLVSAVLDPERVYDFDKNLSDNQWYEETEEGTLLRYAERAFAQYAHVLHWYGGLGG